MSFLSSYDTDYLSSKIDDLNCPSSNYLTIFQCSFDTYIDSGCVNVNSYDATVYCCECLNFLYHLLNFLQISQGSGTVILSLV